MDNKVQYQFNRNAFKIETLEEANNHFGFWKDKSHKERLNAAFYLISQCYNVSSASKLDRTVFSKRKHA